MNHDGVLNSVLFCVWGFPEPTQTFIHRELSEMEACGERISVLASHRVAHPSAPVEIQAMADRALYLGPIALWLFKGLVFGLCHPRQFLGTLFWVAGLPHRTAWHRLRALGLVFAAASVSNEVTRRGFRYLHAHFAHHAELVMPLARFTHLPWGATFHAVGIWRERNLLRQKLELAQVVMTCTKNNHTELLRHAPHRAGSVHVVYHGLEDEIFQRAVRPPAECSTFVAVGRLVEKKGLDVLLRAWSHLQAPRPRLQIVGDGPLRGDLEDLARTLGVAGDVEFTGSLPNREVLALVGSCRAMVQPSLQTSSGDMDGIPNVIIEAMALGRAVIASDVSGIPEVVIHERTGLLVAQRDVLGLAEAIGRIARDDELVSELGHAARHLVEDKFRVKENVADQLALIARAVMDGTPVTS